MKIVLCAINAKYIHSNLGIYSLYTYAAESLRESCSENNMDIHICEYTINNEREKILNSLYLEKADVIAFSCYIWNIDVVLLIARELKKVQKEVKIWLGGPEVSYDADRVLEENDFIQLVMKGEGEKTFAALIRMLAETADCLDEADAADLPEGIVIRQGDILRTTADRRPMNMDELPFVYQDLAEFENRIIYYETARGCPFRCSYCLSSIDKGLRLRSLDKVKRELQFFLDNNVKQVKFIDRTFNADKRHSRVIWSYIAKHDNGITNFHFEISADLLEEEDFNIIKNMRAGLIQLEVGMQTTNPDTIAEIRRTMNIDRLAAAMGKLVSMGTAHVHLDLIVGLPFEDMKSFRKSFNDAWAMKPDNLQLGFLKVLKGSYMEEEKAEYELVYSDFPPYEIMSNKWIGYDDIIRLKAIEQVLEIYGNSRQYTYSLKYLMEFSESAYDFFDVLGAYYCRHGYDVISLKRTDRYKVLLEFGEAVFGLENEQLTILKQLLTVDLYYREKLKSRPEFAADISGYHQLVTEFFINQGNSEYKIQAENYESKVFARKMHIEPVQIDIYNISKGMKLLDKNQYLLFDYDDRNPIDNNGRIVVIKTL